MVSAVTGALLVPYAPAGQARLTLLLGCYAMFGLSLIASLIVITMVWSRLAYHRTGPARLVPTLWIVLGPLGQSIAGANLLGGVSQLAMPHPYAVGAQVFGVLFGVPTFGFAMLWLVLAMAITLRAIRAGLPFALTWWSFIFPFGAFVTGVTALADHTHAVVLAVVATALYVGLVAAWLVVAARTAHGVVRGHLFQPVPSRLR
jgi:tellurite resistance protein TehA-like permease